MINIKEIEAIVFEGRDAKVKYTEAIDGSHGYRPVSGWGISKGYLDWDTDEYHADKWELTYEDIFNCYDGWDSHSTVEGIFNTYEEAVLGAYTIMLQPDN